MRPQEHRALLTERAVIHDLAEDFTENTPSIGPFFEARLDRIEAEDIAHFESLVNFGGFWGERAGASEYTRRRFISKTLDGSLYKLLIEIIKSEKVQNEIRKLIDPLTHDRKAMKLFVCSFIVNVLGFRFSINDWQTMFDGQWVRSVMKRYKDQVHHFLVISGDCAATIKVAGSPTIILAG